MGGIVGGIGGAAGTMRPMGIRRVCAGCHRLTENTTRCVECEARRERARYQSRTHYHGDYQARARSVRANASACWICGEGYRPDDPWQADHVMPGDPNSLLLAAHRSCNASRGDAKGRRPETTNRMEKR